LRISRKDHLKQNNKKLKNMKSQHKKEESNMHANITTGEKLKTVSKNRKWGQLKEYKSKQGTVAENRIQNPVES